MLIRLRAHPLGSCTLPYFAHVCRQPVEGFVHKKSPAGCSTSLYASASLLPIPLSYSIHGSLDFSFNLVSDIPVGPIFLKEFPLGGMMLKGNIVFLPSLVVCVWLVYLLSHESPWLVGFSFVYLCRFPCLGPGERPKPIHRFEAL